MGEQETFRTGRAGDYGPERVVALPQVQASLAALKNKLHGSSVPHEQSQTLNLQNTSKEEIREFLEKKLDYKDRQLINSMWKALQVQAKESFESFADDAQKERGQGTGKVRQGKEDSVVMEIAMNTTKDFSDFMTRIVGQLSGGKDITLADVLVLKMRNAYFDEAEIVMKGKKQKAVFRNSVKSPATKTVKYVFAIVPE